MSDFAVILKRGVPSYASMDSWWRLTIVASVLPFGLVLVSLANGLSSRGSQWGVPLFWTGMIVIFAAAAICLWSRQVTRREAVGILVLTGLALYSAKVLHSPAGLTGYDELLHYGTLDDIIATERLFAENSLLPISPYYPGLEIVTAMLIKVSGGQIFLSALLVIALAKVLMVLGVFLFFERIAEPPRLAALGTLMYMACPSFVFFDSMHAYESLALPLAAFCLFAYRAAQLNEGNKRLFLNAAGTLSGVAAVATHHVTSFILIAALLLWTVLTVVFKAIHSERLPGGGWGPVVIVGAGAAWLLTVASAVVGYLWPHAVSAMREMSKILSGEAASRRLFESNVGISAPILERVAGLASAGIIAACIPIGLWYLWRHQRTHPVAWVLALGASAYPFMMALRFTRNGWDIGSRAMAFIYIPLALVLVGAAELMRNSRFPALKRTAVAVPVIVVIFVGGVIAGSNPSTRMPRPYRAGSGELSIDAETIAAASWARTVLGPNNRIAADATNASILGSYGGQRVVTSADDVSITGLFLSPGYGRYQDSLIKQGRINYVLVDRRLAGTLPLSGFFYEKWEKEIVDYDTMLDPETLDRFDGIEGVSRIYDSGNIQIYDVSGVLE